MTLKRAADGFRLSVRAAAVEEEEDGVDDDGFALLLPEAVAVAGCAVEVAPPADDVPADAGEWNEPLPIAAAAAAAPAPVPECVNAPAPREEGITTDDGVLSTPGEDDSAPRDSDWKVVCGLAAADDDAVPVCGCAGDAPGMGIACTLPSMAALLDW